MCSSGVHERLKRDFRGGIGICFDANMLAEAEAAAGVVAQFCADGESFGACKEAAEWAGLGRLAAEFLE